MTRTDTFDIHTDPITDLALGSDLDRHLLDALNSDRRIEIAAAVNLVINQRLSESGRDGDWSAADIITAILGIADEADRMAAFIADEITDPTATIELQHGLAEGAENDYGDAQVTVLNVVTRGQRGVAESLRYVLPADPDNDGVYCRAFKAADAYLAEWLTAHGIDPTAAYTWCGGRYLTFTRSQWR
jgi:hypothetical protein